MKHFGKILDPGGAVARVALQPPPQASVFRRARRKVAVGYLDRVCTAEAVAWLLRELGEGDAECLQLVRHVELNNAALLGARSLREWLALERQHEGPAQNDGGGALAEVDGGGAVAAAATEEDAHGGRG